MRRGESTHGASASPAVVGLITLVLLASTPLSRFGPPQQELASTASGSAMHPPSLQFSATGTQGEVAAQPQPLPTYDEQLGTTFTQNFSALTYNVTALAQTDANGYGPAYVLNGLSSTGYWYQVGISYHWPTTSGGYNPSFGFSYEVYNPDGKSVYPSSVGAGLGTFSKTVDSGDLVLLSLTFSGTTVQMLAQDLQTGAVAETSFSSEGASSFVGDTSSMENSRGYFTGLMTEWYHVGLYMGNEEGVTYTNQAVALTSAWLWIDEFDTSGPSSPIFSNQTQTPVIIANDKDVYPFAWDGATMSISAHQFVTGILSTTTSLPTKVTLTSAIAGAPSLSFLASYTLNGQPQNAVISTGTATLESDSSTTITVTISPPSPSPLEKWVFSSSSDPTEVTFPAGQNSTYVYYELVEETVSYQVATGGQALPASSPPELTYEEPPPVASATPSQVATTQPLGAAPVEVFVLVGSDAGVNGTIAGTAGERWAATTAEWSVSAPNTIPDPILFYQQYQVSVSYSIVGGGTPSQTPALNSTSLGSPAVIQLSTNRTTGWFDAGSLYSFTSVLNGSTPTERWLHSGGQDSGRAGVGVSGGIFAPDETIFADYTHQYYVEFGLNDPRGGSVSPGSGWFDAGSSLNATTSASARWQFESWTGSGIGAYSGTSPSVNLTVTGPLSENATFYVQLTISADSRTNIAFSYASETGTVQSGTTKTIYVPPSSKVSLRASPSLFVYSFASWQGVGLANATKPSVALVVDTPSVVAATSSYNYPVVVGATAIAVAIILAGFLLIRNRRRRERLYGFGPP